MKTDIVVDTGGYVERPNGKPKKRGRAEVKPDGNGSTSNVGCYSQVNGGTAELPCLAPASPELIDALTTSVGLFLSDPPKLRIIRAEALNQLQGSSAADPLTERQVAELMRGHPVTGKKKAFIVTDEAHRQIARRFHELRMREAEEAVSALRDLLQDFAKVLDDPERRLRLKECAYLSGMSVDTVKQYCQYEKLPVIRRDTRLKKDGEPGLPTGKTSAWRVKRKDLLKHLDRKTEVLK